jgi:glucokinase
MDRVREASEAPEPSRLAEELCSDEPSAAITRAGIEKRDPVCLETLQLFASVCGSEAESLTLR